MDEIVNNFTITGLIEVMVNLSSCHWILRQVFYIGGFSFLVVIPWHGCFGTIDVSTSMELHHFFWIPQWSTGSTMLYMDLKILITYLIHFQKVPNGQLTPS